MTDYQTKRNKSLGAFESIGLCKLGNMELAMADRLEEITGTFARRFLSHAMHNLHVNIPCDIIPGDIEPTELAYNTAKSAIVSSVGSLVQWDVLEAMEICADILEDVSAHPEAAKMRDTIEVLGRRKA